MTMNTTIIKKYIGYKYIDNKYDPSRYKTISPFGELCSESIQYLRDKQVLDLNNNLKIRIFWRLPADENYIRNLKLSSVERNFSELFEKTQRALIRRFRWVSTDDVIRTMRSGEFVQYQPRVTLKDMEDYILEYESRMEPLGDHEVDELFSQIVAKKSAQVQ